MEKIAIVTGASSGIGKAIYEGLKGSFDTILGVSRRGPDISVDLSLESQTLLWTQIYAKLHLNFPTVVLLVNTAGIMPFDAVQDRKVFDVNFWGAYNMIKILEPAFVPKASCIINIASVSGIVHDADLPIYSASKAALISLTKSLAKKYAPNTRVNCISPGFFYPTNLAPGEPTKELIDKVPMGYAEHPKRLVQVVKTIYETSYMTGANIVVDGGLSC